MFASTLLRSSVTPRVLALSTSTMSFYALSAIRSDGTLQPMEEYRGKVVYATNVASFWGLTRREYDQFERLGARWGDRLEILAFPSKEWGNQEYDTDAEIQKFAAKNNFPGTLMKLGKVLGEDAPEVWKFFKQQTGAPDPVWNFKGKFLVSKTGKVSVPQGDVEAAIEALMKE